MSKLFTLSAILLHFFIGTELFAANKSVPPGTLVQKSGICQLVLGALGLESPLYRVVRHSNADDLKQFTGKNVEVVLLHDAPLFFPAENRNVVEYYYDYGISVKGTLPVKDANYDGRKVELMDLDGNPFTAYSHSDDRAPMAGRLVEVTGPEKYVLLADNGQSIDLFSKTWIGILLVREK